MFKKIVVLIVSAMLVCMAFATVSSAAGSCKSDLKYSVEGETLSVTVTYSDFNDPDGVIGVSCNLYFDKAVLEYQSTDVDMPTSWGDQGTDWTKLFEDGNVLVAFLFDSGETGKGTTEPITFTVNFKILKSGTESTVEIKNSELTESGDLDIIYAANNSLKIAISESGDVSIDVSEDEVSLPDESEPEVSENVSSSESDVSGGESDSNSSESDNPSAPAVSDDVGNDDTNGGNWWIWVIVVVAVIGIAGGVAFFVMKKKD